MLLREFPIASFDGLSDAGQLKVGVGEARAVEQVLEPGASGNAVGGSEVGFAQQELLVDGIELIGCEFASGQRLLDGALGIGCGLGKLLRGLDCGAEVQFGGVVVRVLLKIGEELSDGVAVELVVVGQDVGLGQAQGGDSP